MLAKQGRGAGDEKLKQKIANCFEVTYEEFLSFGVKLLALETEQEIKEPFPGFNKMMSYPVEGMAYQIDRLAVEHAGIPAEMVASI